MLNWSKKSKKKPEFNLPGWGVLKLNKDGKESSWFGIIRMFVPKKKVELTIEVEADHYPSEEQIRLIRAFESNWPKIENVLIEHLFDSFRGTRLEKPKEELREMYFLSAIDLKRGNLEWWIVLEPEFNVPTLFSFLPRFTFSNDQVTWSNLY